MPDPLSWIIIAICIVFSFFFSALETSLSCCNRYKIKVLADEGSKRAKIVVRCLDKYDSTLTSMLIGNNIAAIALSSISAILFAKYFKAIGLESWASFFNTLIMTFVVYILGDTLPKTIAKAIPDTMAIWFSPFAYFFLILFYPISILFSLMARLFEKIFKIKEETPITTNDLEKAVDNIEEENTDIDEYTDIIQNALDFGDTNVKEVLTAKKNMFALDINELTNESLNEIILKHSYSRIPIYDGDKNNIIGTLHVKTYIEEYFKNNNVDIRSVLTKPYFVSPKIMIDDLFKGFKSHHTHIAIVKDNDKDIVIGVVTMDDVLEELVEDISETNRLEKQ